MYLHTFGGSALLHLLAAHPKIVGVFGIAAVVTMVMAPHGPGRYLGTATHIARLEAALGDHRQVSESRQVAAERAAARMLEEGGRDDIRKAVEHTLRRCGSGCTDLSTASVIEAPGLLRAVLLLYQLDRTATSQTSTPGPAGAGR